MTICILNTTDIDSAHLAQTELESHGIQSRLQTNDAGGTLPHLRMVEGVQIFVAEEDEKRARDILKDSE